MYTHFFAFGFLFAFETVFKVSSPSVVAPCVPFLALKGGGRWMVRVRVLALGARPGFPPAPSLGRLAVEEEQGGNASSSPSLCSIPIPPRSGPQSPSHTPTRQPTQKQGYPVPNEWVALFEAAAKSAKLDPDQIRYDASMPLFSLISYLASVSCLSSHALPLLF